MFGADNNRFSAGYTAWAGRYLYEYNQTREVFGKIAINARSNATRNPGAVMSAPLTMDDYLGARLIRWPYSILDIDPAVDGAEAFILTTTDRARDLALPPALIHSGVHVQMGNGYGEEDRIHSLQNNGQHVAVKALRARSDLWVDDVDALYLYDGFTSLALTWMENAGFCAPGEGNGFMDDNWDPATNRIMIRGRVPVNSHGGDLAEGSNLGAGHVREAVHQIQGLAGERQVPDAKNCMVLLGGITFNSEGFILRASD
jgi:acetyl-CoA acetyltransferase